jgi:hypothetical protein
MGPRALPGPRTRAGTYAKELPTVNDPTWCDYHKGHQRSVLVSLQERPSSCSLGYYACAPCRTVKKLTPLVEESESAKAVK